MEGGPDHTAHEVVYTSPIRMFKCMFKKVGLRCCVFFCEFIVRAVSSGGNLPIAWQAWDIVRVSFCVAGVVFETIS